MAESRFVYVTYVRTTAEKLWQALLEPEFTRNYWFGARHESEWREGSAWNLRTPDGRVAHSGSILEIVPQRRLVLSWQAEFLPELRDDGPSRVTFELEPLETAVKLTVIHETERPNSKLIAFVSHGWPKLLSSLKSLLETGVSLSETRHWPSGM